MKQTKMRFTRFRTLGIALVITSFLFSLMVIVTGQRPGFYLDYGAIKAGTYETPMIYVKATKTKDRYDSIDVKEDGELRYAVKVSGQCPEAWRLSSGRLAIYGDSKPEFVSYRVNSAHRSIGENHGQQWDVFDFHTPFLNPKAGSPVDLCNAELDRSNEAERKRIFRDGFNFVLEKAYRANLTIFCDDQPKIGFGDPPKSFSAETNLPLKIRCLPVATTKGPPPREGKPLDFDPPIKSVEVVANPAVTSGPKCPVYVNFKGRITAGEKSQYSTFNTKYRFVGDHDYATDWQAVSIVRGQPRPVYGRRFIQSSDTPRGLKNPGGQQNVPIFHGWMLLEVMLPDGTIRSEKATFSVDCGAPLK
jgi:hypothetical protein